MLRADVGLIVRLTLAFAFWNVVAMYLLPAYSKLLVPVAQWSLDALHRHDAQFSFLAYYPTVEWEVTFPFSQALGKEQTSFRLLTYNLVLYLSALTALCAQPLKRVGLLLATGLPVPDRVK